MRTTIIALLGASSAFKLHSRPAGVTFFEQGIEDTEVIGGNLTMLREGFHYGEHPVQDQTEEQEKVADDELFATGMDGNENLHYSFNKDASLVQFATGMNGDEDLGQNIIMKGDKYHYNQKELVQTGFATGMNGDEDLGQNIIMKGDKYHYNQSMGQFATGMNGDEDLGQNIIMKGDKYHYNQSMGQFATGMNGDEDLGQNIIMKGDKYHYNQSLGQYPYKPPAEPGAPPFWMAYEDRQNAPDEEVNDDPLPICAGTKETGDIVGVNCRIFVTSTSPGNHGNTLQQLGRRPLSFVQDPERGIDGVHDNAAHISTALGDLPTCTGADSDVPETNCTNRRAPICNGLGTNGIPDVSCTPPLPQCNGLPGDNGHPGVDCIAPPLPTCGVDYGGLPGRDCELRTGPAPPGAPALVQRQIPTCTDQHTVNCQPVCTESETTGCTESRTPTSEPMNTWDFRDRFEGTKTWDYSTENRPF